MIAFKKSLEKLIEESKIDVIYQVPAPIAADLMLKALETHVEFNDRINEYVEEINQKLAEVSIQEDDSNVRYSFKD